MIPQSTSRRRFLCQALGVGGVLGLGAWGLRGGPRAHDRSLLPAGLRPTFRTSRALGSQVTIQALHASERVAQRAIDAAFAELDRIEDVMSLYRPGSELCRLNREGSLDRPHPYLVSVLRQAAEVSERTGGAFDVTVQPLWELYARAKTEGRLPDPAELERERRKVDWRRLELSARRLRLNGDGMAVTLNGIAQGFATDRATAVLQEQGIEHALINAGEIRPLGSKALQEPWTVGIQHPRDPQAYAGLVHLDGRALATSGDYETFFTADFRHHHILDPETGDSPTEFSSVSVLVPTAMEADALSTALFVLGMERGLKLIRSTPRADAQFIFKDGRVVTTERFPAIA